MRDIDVGFTTPFMTQQRSPIQQLTDLRGKRVALGRRSSVQAGLMPYHYLKEAGLRLEQDLVCSFHDQRPSSEGSDEAAVVELVAAGEFDAGAVSGRTIAVLRAAIAPPI